MKQHHLGQGMTVPAFGMGCMPLSGVNYGKVDEEEGIATIRRAIDLGVNMFDTSASYGHDHSNELILGRALAGRRDDVIICTKFGIVRDTVANKLVMNSRPELVGPTCDGSLRRLGIDHIDLYYQHRVDSSVPIEETWGAAAELVKAGKVRHLGLCEPGLGTVRRAHAVHPVTAVQNEYSLISRDPEGSVLDTLRDMGIGLVCFAPLGRGFLSGKIRNPDDFAADDFRRKLPRFQGENFYTNLRLVDLVHELASARGVTTAQFALAWLLAQGEDVVPIPGIETREQLDENVVAFDIELTAAELAAIDEIVPDGALGERYVPGDATIGAETAPLPASS